VLQRFRLLLVLAIVVLGSALVAACGSGDDGGGSSAGAAGTDGKAAEAIPADSLFFTSVNIDSSSDAWKQLTEVGSRFPGWAQIVQEFNTSLNETSEDGTSWSADIQPWLGGEAGIAVTSLDLSQPSSPEPVVVGYVESKDDAKAAAVITKTEGVKPLADYKGYKRWGMDDDGFAAIGKNAVLIGTSEAVLQQAIDTREGGGAALADAQSFKDTLQELPEDNLGVVYVDGPKLAQLVALAAQAAPLPATGDDGAGAAQQQQLTQALDQLRVLKSVGMSFGADDGGFRFRTATIVDEERAKTLGILTEDFEPSLTGRVPATTLAYFGFQNLGPMLKTALDGLTGQSPQVAQAIGAIEAMTGANFDTEVVPLLSGEHALYVAPGNPGPIPAVGLLLKPTDAAQGAATLRKLTAALVRELGASGEDAGVNVEDIPNGQRFSGEALSGLSVVWRQSGDVIAVSNDATAGDEPAESLADSDKWKDLKKSAGVGDDVAALAYVDIPGTLDALRAAGAGAEIDSDPNVAANIKPLGGLAMWGDSKDGGISTADVYLEVRPAG
jgi:hypothetical protein